METKITWEEMKRHCPNEWLLIIDYDTDESGHILAGIVARHSTEKDEVYRLPALKKSSAFKMTLPKMILISLFRRVIFRNWIGGSKTIGNSLVLF